MYGSDPGLSRQTRAENSICTAQLALLLSSIHRPLSSDKQSSAAARGEAFCAAQGKTGMVEDPRRFPQKATCFFSSLQKSQEISRLLILSQEPWLEKNQGASLFSYKHTHTHAHTQRSPAKTLTPAVLALARTS